MKKALLVISFGTLYKETRERTIEAIENDLKIAFPDRLFYRAWTSDFIIKKLDFQIDNVKEALERMLRDGVTDVIIIPTNIICGTEYNKIKDTSFLFRDKFDSIKLSSPLISDHEDIKALAKMIETEFSYVKSDEILALMGHGSKNVNTYDTLNEIFAADGYPNFCVGTVEFEPGFRPVSDTIKKIQPEKVILTPLLVVAGDHAVNDMAGDNENSWKSRIHRYGIRTECIIKGMGEYKAFRDLYIKKAEKI